MGFLRLLALMGIAIVAAFQLSAGSVHAEDFKVGIVDASGNRLFFPCAPAPGRKNGYGTSPRIQTTTQPGKWLADARSAWRLGFDRSSQAAAGGGRCETAANPSLKGDGIFSARIWIDGKVADSTGVFTIAILPVPFDRDNELDLAVINLQDDNGTPVVKFGRPGSASAVPLSDLVNRWSTVLMVKRSQTCAVTIARDGAPPLFLPGTPCSLSEGMNRIVINSRSRNGGALSGSSVLIGDVYWAPMSRAGRDR